MLLDAPVFLISAILVTVTPGMMPATSSNGVCFASSAHSLSSMSTPPEVMTLCAVSSASKVRKSPGGDNGDAYRQYRQDQQFSLHSRAPLKLKLLLLPKGYLYNSMIITRSYENIEYPRMLSYDLHRKGVQTI